MKAQYAAADENVGLIYGYTMRSVENDSRVRRYLGEGEDFRLLCHSVPAHTRRILILDMYTLAASISMPPLSST